MKKEEIKALHLISSSGFLGAENVVLELAKQSRAAGHRATIGVFENQRNPHLELAETAAAEGLNVQIFPCRGRWDKRTISDIRIFIRRERPNLIHSHGYKSNFYAIVTKHSKFPWVVTNHLWKRTTLNLKLYARLDSLLTRYANKIVAVSEEIASELSSYGIPQNKLKVIDNGIDLNKFSRQKKDDTLKRAFGFDERSRIIGTIASLTEEKGHDYLLQAAKGIILSFPDANFLIVGDGRERHRLEEKVAELGLTGKVIFAGTRKDIPEILSILDLFVLPSLKEGLPMALLEALASCLPVIATDVGAVSKVIISNETGLLIKSADTENLREAIATLLSDKSQALRLGLQGHKKVEAEFSSQAMSAKYFNLYRQVLTE